MRIFFASDLHGSERCYRKFLNAAAFHEADALVLGGDLTAKAILPIVDLGRGRYIARLMNDDVIAVSAEELPGLDRKVRDLGLYPYVADAATFEAAARDKTVLDGLFEQAMRFSLRSWLALAEERLSKQGRRCYLIPGNDDLPIVDEVLADAPDELVNVVAEPAWLDDNLQIVGLDYVNPTPWASPREASEDELALRIAAAIERAEAPGRTILNMHCPPIGSGLDVAPLLTKDLRPVVFAGIAATKPVGSQSMRDAIERYQPLLGLHGHIHESPGIARVGETTCINPGSNYGEGVLRGAIIDIQRGRVVGHRLVEG
jgi:uncharacterized protein